jgi:hypothetical protein
MLLARGTEARKDTLFHLLPKFSTQEQFFGSPHWKYSKLSFEKTAYSGFTATAYPLSASFPPNLNRILTLGCYPLIIDDQTRKQQLNSCAVSGAK